MWYILTVVLAVAVAFLAFYAFNKKVSVRWWEWLMLGLGLFLFVFALQNVIGTFIEKESQAAVTMMWTLGIPALILIVVPVVMVTLRKIKA